MPARVTCLSPFDESTVLAMFDARHEVEVVLVPPPPDQPAVKAACRTADLVIGDRRHRHRIDRETLREMTKCLLIQQAAVGFDSIDHRAAAEFGIPVANAAGYNKDAVADWTVMAMIALLRRSFSVDRQIRAGRWSIDDPMRGTETFGRELGSMTVGIIGMGNVGESVARRLSPFGSRILFSDAVPRDVAGTTQVDLDTLLERSDIVSVHAPLDVGTRALIGAEQIGRMKDGSYLVNAARGAIVDEAALVEALKSGHLAGAGLDVFEFEPLPLDSPLRILENVILAPHRGGATVEAEARLLGVLGANLRRVLNGEAPVNVVNGVAVARAR